MTERADHFSKQSDAYARYRPRYPDALFRYLAAEAGRSETAWDCGTGSGQAAVGLARHFARVWATDASAAQIANAAPHPRIAYYVRPAEDSGFAPRSVGLVTVAQALHWFDIDRFYAEVARVLKPGGLIAVWSYALMRVSPEIDEVVHRFHDECVGPYWPAARKYVVEGYASVRFPFDEREPPTFRMSTRWDAESCLGYLRSWSAVQRFIAANSHDPVEDIAPALRRAWGRAGAQRTVRWPLRMRVGALNA
jgi:SAM-dependent methyltransferase